MSDYNDWKEFIQFRNFSKATNYGEGFHILDDGSTLCINEDGSGSFDGTNGSSGYLYSDGSGSFDGANGSSGYLYSDGSGSFDGANGSSGYLYSDGSGNFDGANGSSGYLYSDGSGNFDDANGSSDYLYSDGSVNFDSAEGSSDDSSEGAGLLGTAIGLGLVGVMAHKANREKERAREEAEEARREAEREAKRQIKKQKAKEKRAKRHSFYKRHWKGLVVGIIVVALLLSGGGLFLYYSSLIPMSYSAEEVEGMNYEELSNSLRDRGYRHVLGTEAEDLAFANLDQEGIVIAMTVDGKTDYKKGKRYPEDVTIRIKYHSAKMVSPPATSKEMEGKNYKKVIASFKKQGFGNVKAKGEEDSFITRWLNDDGDVKSVTIGGEEDYSTTSLYRVDDEIVIVYHKK